ncbi:MAG TPA: GntR family transcriptional regulator [Rhizobiaceae bacterium]|nr:GntR family transcriptional regulator [Rhizobiaceae bacterium]
MTNVDTLEDPYESESEVSGTILHDRVVDHLREMIITGELEPGERIPERSLCAKLKISRTPLREALKVLAAEDMVALLPYRGAVVRKLSAEETQDILSLLGTLEEWGAKLACERATSAEIEAIAAKHAEMMKCYDEGDLEEYFKHNLQFHESIISASHNRVLEKSYKSLNNRVVKQRLAWNGKIQRWKDSVLQHEKIIAALAKRDAQAMAAAVSEHYTQSKMDIRPSARTRS